MSGHRRKRCWFCAQNNIRVTFKNRTRMRTHIETYHSAEVKEITTFHKSKKRGVPNVVHYGARMRRKLGLEYSPEGHLRPVSE